MLGKLPVEMDYKVLGTRLEEIVGIVTRDSEDREARHAEVLRQWSQVSVAEMKEYASMLIQHYASQRDPVQSLQCKLMYAIICKLPTE